MRIYRSLAGLPSDFGPCALTIGNFDGVHVGHRRILRRVKEISSERGWKASVLTFDPHPTRVVAPGRTPPLLDRKSTRLNSSHRCISYAVFCLKKTTGTKREPAGREPTPLFFAGRGGQVRA